MNQLVPTPPRRIASLDNPKMLAHTRVIAAKDCNESEFNQFIHIARHLGLDPLAKQIYAFVFNKDKPDRRSMSVIIGINGYRSIAARTGNYRPDDKPPTFRKSAALKDASNPEGIISCTVRVYQYSHGEWHKIVGTAKWAEYAPLKDEWATDDETGQNYQTGHKTLAKDSSWFKSPELMLSKCAEAAALRRAWPEDFSNTYEEAEIERYKVLDLTPSEYANLGLVEERKAKLGGPSFIIDFMANQPLENVPKGQMTDRLMKFIDEHEHEPEAVLAFRERNRASFNEYWAQLPGEALEVKRRIELCEQKLRGSRTTHAVNGGTVQTGRPQR